MRNSIVWLLTISMSSQSVMASSESIEVLAVKAAIAPFDKTQIQEFLNVAKARSDELNKTAQGKTYLEQAQKLQKVYALKSQLDKCYGKDTSTSEVGNRILKAALLKDVTIECSPKNALKDLDAFANELSQLVDSNKNSVKASSIAKDIFKDTAVSAAKVEARFKFLIQDEMKGPDLLEVLCGQQTCSNELKTKLQAAASAEVAGLKEKNIKPRKASDISAELNDKASAMYAALYSPLTSYHMSGQSAEKAARFHQMLTEGGSLQNVMKKTGFAEQMGRVPVPATPQERVEKEKELLAEVPFEFAYRQQEIADDPVAQLLSRESQWNETLGIHGHPSVIQDPRTMYVSLEPYDRPALIKTRMTVSDRFSYITPKNIIDSRQNQLSNVKVKLGSVFQKLNSPQLTEDDAFEVLKDLLIANPRSAAQIMMDQPQVLNIYCRALKEISKEETQRTVLGWSLVGLTLGTLPFTFVSGPTGTVAATMLAGLSAADMTAGLVGGMRVQELSDLQRAACFSDSGDRQSCNDYIQSMNKAVGLYVGAGLSSAGLIPFVKAVGRAAGGSVVKLSESVSHFQSVTTKFESTAGKQLLSELGEDSGDFLAELMKASPDRLKSFVKELDGLKPDQITQLSTKLRAEIKNPGACVI